MTKIQNLKIIIFALIIFLIGALGISAIFLSTNSSNKPLHNNDLSLIETASAQEIYPLFECPCCGKAIDECSCPMAQERKAFVDGLAAAGISEDKAVLIYVKKYGLDSFIEEERQKEFREKLAKEAPAERPIISLIPEMYNFGDVSQKEGKVYTQFDLKNEGKSDLVIDRLETSCGCTSASIVFKGKEGPKFNMPGHDINEEIKDWQVVIGPGETAELKVYYDPNVHPDFRGEAIREVYIFSNDPIDFQKKVAIELNQID